MMFADNLRKSVLQAAVQGKLTEQLPTDGYAFDLLKKIRAEKAKLIKSKKIKPATLPPISDDELPFKIPANWCWVRLGDVSLKIHYGYTASANLEGNVKLLRITDIQDDKVNWNNVPLCTVTDSQKKEYLLHEGDIVIARTGGTIGKTFIVENLTEDAVFASYLIRIIFDKNILPKYIKNFAGTPFYWKQIRDKSQGTGQPNVNGVSLSKLILPLPPIAEQERIVAKLDKILAEIELLAADERELADLEKNFPRQMKNSLLLAAVQGKLTEQLPTDGYALDLLKKIQTEKAKLIKSKKIKPVTFPPISDDELPFKIPANWCWARLGDVCEYIQRGKSPDYSLEKKYPVISQKCNQPSGFTISFAKFISADSLKSYDEKKFLLDGDLLWNSTGLGTVGRIGIYEKFKNPYELAVADSHLTVIRLFKNFILHKFVYFYIASPVIQSKIPNMITGSTKQKELNLKTVQELILPLPPIAEQERIVAKLDELLPLCEI